MKSENITSKEDPFGRPLRLGRSKGRAVEGSGKPQKSGSESGAHPSRKSTSSGGGGVSISSRIRAARRTPEAVVKIASYGGGRSSTRDVLDYIGREGTLRLETDRGEIIEDRDGYSDLAREWASADQKEGAKRKTMHMLVSAPKGADAEKTLEAARLYGEKVFGENFPYVMVLHEDRDHPHVHFLVRTKGRDGQRFRIEPGGFQKIREAFAESCREVGIEMNATPREMRGAARSESMQLRKMREDGRKPRIDARAEAFVQAEKKNPQPPRNIPREKRLAKLKKEAAAHRKLASALEKAAGDRGELQQAAQQLRELATWLDAGGAQTRPDRVRGLSPGRTPEQPEPPRPTEVRKPQSAAKAAQEGRKLAARMVEALPEGPERARAEQALADLRKAGRPAPQKAPAVKVKTREEQMREAAAAMVAKLPEGPEREKARQALAALDGARNTPHAETPRPPAPAPKKSRSRSEPDRDR